MSSPCLRILVIEDEHDTADTMRMLLELLGHQVAVAYGGIDGVHTAQEFRPDVVLCDLALPGMDGYAVARALQELPELAETLLVAISGYAPEALPLRCREPRFDEFLLKPVEVDQLQTVLRQKMSLADSGTN